MEASAKNLVNRHLNWLTALILRIYRVLGVNINILVTTIVWNSLTDFFLLDPTLSINSFTSALQCYFSYGFSVSVSVTVVIFQLQLLFFSFYFYFS